MPDKPEIACTNCGWTGFTEELLDGEERGEFQCPECFETDSLMPWQDYVDCWEQWDQEGCPPYENL